MVVTFVWQSHFSCLAFKLIFIQLQLQKAHMSFEFLFAVNLVDFRSFCKTEMEMNKNLLLGVILKFRRLYNRKLIN